MMQLEANDYQIVRNEVINGVRYVTAYPSQQVCSIQIDIEIIDRTIQKVAYTGGCNGNTQGLGALLKGMSVDDAISKLKGISCGGKATSCPDQLARVLEEI